jgi:hypothetical protein
VFDRLTPLGLVKMYSHPLNGCACKHLLSQSTLIQGALMTVERLLPKPHNMCAALTMMGELLNSCGPMVRRCAHIPIMHIVPGGREL